METLNSIIVLSSSIGLLLIFWVFIAGMIDYDIQNTRYQVYFNRLCLMHWKKFGEMYAGYLTEDYIKESADVVWFTIEDSFKLSETEFLFNRNIHKYVTPLEEVWRLKFTHWCRDNLK